MVSQRGTQFYKKLEAINKNDKRTLERSCVLSANENIFAIISKACSFEIADANVLDKMAARIVSLAPDSVIQRIPTPSFSETHATRFLFDSIVEQVSHKRSLMSHQISTLLCKCYYINLLWRAAVRDGLLDNKTAQVSMLSVIGSARRLNFLNCGFFRLSLTKTLCLATVQVLFDHPRS